MRLCEFVCVFVFDRYICINCLRLRLLIVTDDVDEILERRPTPTHHPSSTSTSYYSRFKRQQQELQQKRTTTTAVTNKLT